MKTSIIAIILLMLSVFVLTARSVGGAVLDWGAAAAFIALCFSGLFSSAIREWSLFLVSIALSVLLLRKVDGFSVFQEALGLAAYFAAFILLLTMLKIAAERSRAVLEVGRFLICQPSSRRFIATAMGGHLLGVFLNFGAISLMAPLIQNATKKPDGSNDAQMERRQLSALLRGFAWILLWAPTTLSQAVLLTLFTEVNLAKILIIGASTSIIMILVGLLYDRIEWRKVATLDKILVSPFPKLSFIRLSLICGALIIATAALQVATGFSTALALMFVAPVVTLVWFVAQNSQQSVGIGQQLVFFWPALKDDATGLARSAIALGLSGFIGRVLAEILPMEHITTNLSLSSIPGWAFLAIIPLMITLGGQIAVSPIILVVFIGQVTQSIVNLPADPTHIVFALSAGWAISMFASPNATATLLISAATKIPPVRLTWGWNLRYAALCYLILVGIFILLEVSTIFGWSDQNF